jgi:inositol-1,3,4-trisphosphate 5/6-kinase / inositol-tetrakisphosphate 1-kinase
LNAYTSFFCVSSFTNVDIPLEDQQGGQIDVILHKLTEDILCMSQIESTMTSLAGLISTGNAAAAVPFSCLVGCPLQQNHNHPPFPQPVIVTDSRDVGCDHQHQPRTREQLDSTRRIQQLLDYKHNNMECCLVDHPMSVQTVMSRADIATTLQLCLQNVQTTSGIQVRSPAYAVVHDISSNIHSVPWHNLSFPIIVKPLTAAGTKASHAMTVIMENDNLNILQSILRDKVPCLCQEYLNHDAVLYKVYVLGDFISVHQRRSLPNLPRIPTTASGTATYPPKSVYTHVEFDSQRPYPHLSDFGYTNLHTGIYDDDDIESENIDQINVVDKMTNDTAYIVNAKEVKPIVDALKRAFRLELFGFDILMTTTNGPPQYQQSVQPTMLVVDVNYFPSYKEVTDFPTLLAQYLTHCAISTNHAQI